MTTSTSAYSPDSTTIYLNGQTGKQPLPDDLDSMEMYYPGVNYKGKLLMFFSRLDIKAPTIQVIPISYNPPMFQSRIRLRVRDVCEIFTSEPSSRKKEAEQQACFQAMKFLLSSPFSGCDLHSLDPNLDEVLGPEPDETAVIPAEDPQKHNFKGRLIELCSKRKLNAPELVISAATDSITGKSGFQCTATLSLQASANDALLSKGTVENCKSAAVPVSAIEAAAFLNIPISMAASLNITVSTQGSTESIPSAAIKPKQPNTENTSSSNYTSLDNDNRSFITEISEIFPRKKHAEHNACMKVLRQLGVDVDEVVSLEALQDLKRSRIFDE